MEALDGDRELTGLKFGIEKSMRYHQRRRAFLEGLHRFLMFLVVVVGSTAAAQIIGAQQLLALVAALIAAFDLVYAPGMRARDHIMLNQRYSVVMAEMLRTLAPDMARIAEWKAQRILIEADEPPIYWALEKDCWNEVCYALGKATKETLCALSWHERFLMNVWRFDTATAARPG